MTDAAQSVEPGVTDADLDPGLVALARLEGPVVAVYCSPEVDEVVAITGPEEEGGDWAAWDRLPRLAPVIRWHQATPPALLVAIDRTGADLVSGGRARQPVLESVTDDEHPYIRKIQPGGWSQRRYQQRAENSWRAVAGEVADRVTGHVEANGARLVVVAGDVRAVQQLRDLLPDAAIVAAWDSGAGVRVVPTMPELTDGLGAVLRFPVAR